MKRINVKVVFRNYIPLYSGYCSFWLSKMPNVNVIIPKPNAALKKVFKLYRRLRNLPFVSHIVKAAQRIFFEKRGDDKDTDLYFYADMIPSKKMNKPFVVDFEHAYALFNYTEISNNHKRKVLDVLTQENCKRILPWSIAGKDTLRELYKNEYHLIKDKVEVVYPAQARYSELYKNKADYSLVNRNKKLKLLSVGRDPYGKGIVESLAAFNIIYKKVKNIQFYCISEMPEKSFRKYSNSAVFFFPWKFANEEVIRKFFLTCDLFVLPTHGDTFGMVFLEALSCGMPVITTRQFAIPEIIKEGVNGFLVESDKLFLNMKMSSPREYSNRLLGYREIEKKLVNNLVQRIEYFTKNRKILASLRENCTEEFEPGGKFSIETRNKELTKIFKEAIRG